MNMPYRVCIPIYHKAYGSASILCFDTHNNSHAATMQVFYTFFLSTMIPEVLLFLKFYESEYSDEENK